MSAVASAKSRAAGTSRVACKDKAEQTRVSEVKYAERNLVMVLASFQYCNLKYFDLCICELIFVPFLPSIMIFMFRGKNQTVQQHK